MATRNNNNLQLLPEYNSDVREMLKLLYHMNRYFQKLDNHARFLRELASVNHEIITKRHLNYPERWFDCFDNSNCLTQSLRSEPPTPSEESAFRSLEDLELMEENRQMRMCLEDYKRGTEMIMHKYREKIEAKLNEKKNELNFMNCSDEKLWKIIGEQREKKYEMAGVMRKAAAADEAKSLKNLEIMSYLMTENKALRELLMISQEYGTYQQPIRINECFRVDVGTQSEVTISCHDEHDSASTSSNCSMPSSSSFTSIASILQRNSFTTAADTTLVEAETVAAANIEAELINSLNEAKDSAKEDAADITFQQPEAQFYIDSAAGGLQDINVVNILYAPVADDKTSKVDTEADYARKGEKLAEN